MTAPRSAPGGGRLDWREVGILYVREMRAALREKSIVIHSILMPIFLYPFVLWAGFTGLMFVLGQTEGFVSRVVVREWPTGHAGLRWSFERDEQIQLRALTEPVADAHRKIKEGRIDAFLEFLPATGPDAALPGNFQARITFNESKERSAAARDRVKGALDDYSERWLKREATARGIGAAEWQGFACVTRNLASGRQMGAFLLGLVLPAFFVVMVAVGCFYPAVDATAGERERHTWETLMSTAASRVSIVTAKYLHVASLGSLAGILNLVAVMVTVKPIFAPMLAKAGEAAEFAVPLAAIPVLVLAALLLGSFVAGGMMIFAAFARTFKEGQAMITPFYLVILLPVMFLTVPGLKFSLPLAFVPIVNLILTIRGAVAGTFAWPQMGITLLVSLALIAACVRLATFILQFEDVVAGSYGGSFHTFFRERMLGRAKPGKTVAEVTR